MLRTLIDNLPDRIFVKDRQGRVLVNNVAHARGLGLHSPEEAVGVTDSECLTAELAAKSREDEERVLLSGETLSIEEQIPNRSTGKEEWAQTTKVPLRDGEGRIFSQRGPNGVGGVAGGLHDGALAAKEMGGQLKAFSEGLGTGATFTLELPSLPSVAPA